MNEGEHAAGSSRPAGEPPIQPATAPATELDAPIPWSQVRPGITPGQTEQVRRLDESLERRLYDRQLRDELARSQFSGRRYMLFETELVRYAISVLRAWMYTGYIFRIVATRGFSLHPSDNDLDELRRDSDAREELAAMTVAVALPRFREQALIGDGWRFEGGASLTTYFMGACLYVFPNEFRKRQSAMKRWRHAQEIEARAFTPSTDPQTDPAADVLGRLRIHDDLRRADPRTRAIVALTLDGYSQQEIADLLGEASVRAVEGALYRWRNKEQQRLGEGGD